MGRPVDLVGILRAGHVLTAEDVAALSSAIELPWQARRRRLDERDTAIREAGASLFLHLGPTQRAEALAGLLRRFLAGLEAPAEIRRIAALNEGATLSPRQIFDVLRGERTVLRE